MDISRAPLADAAVEHQSLRGYKFTDRGLEHLLERSRISRAARERLVKAIPNLKIGP